MDANKIKFVDDDGSVEVLEPPMTARVHIEKPTDELIPQETIEEEHATDLSGDILNIEAVEEAIKYPLEKDILENVVSGAFSPPRGSEPLAMGPVVQSFSPPRGSEPLAMGLVVQREIQEVVEHNIKDLEKIESVLKNPEFYPTEEQKIDEVNEEQKSRSGEDNIDKEALSLVANAVNDVRAKESATPKGCCILQ